MLNLHKSKGFGASEIIFCSSGTNLVEAVVGKPSNKETTPVINKGKIRKNIKYNKIYNNLLYIFKWTGIKTYKNLYSVHGM